jgi:hypothetical protein
MLTPERRVKDQVRKVLKGMGAYYTMPATGGYGSSGVPDFLVCFGGRFVGIECKANGGVPTALQEKNLREIRECGGTALVIDENNVRLLETLMRSV